MNPRHCSYCGHLVHPEECPAQIQIGTAKKQETRPCPCVKRKEDTR